MSNVIKDKSFRFAVKVVKIYKKVTVEQKEYVLSKQFLRSGTAVGAMAREAEYSESRKDFVHKFSIALKEANETRYWIELMRETEFLSQPVFESIHEDVTEIIKILTSIIKSTKSSK